MGKETKKEAYTVDIRIVRHDGKLYESVALIDDPNGKELDIVTFSSEYMSRSGVMHSAFAKAAKKVGEHGGKVINTRTNFVPFFLDLSLQRGNFPLTKVTFEKLAELGITIQEVVLFNDEETGLVL